MPIEGRNGILFPDIKWLELDHPDQWGMSPVCHSNWVMAVGPQVGVPQKELDELYVGDALSHFMEDDGNAFPMFNPENFTPINGLWSKRTLLIRLNWELKAPLPQGLRASIDKVRQQAILGKFRNYDGWLKARHNFRSSAEEVSRFVDSDSQLKSTVNRSRSFSVSSHPTLKSAWEEYIELIGG